MKGRIIFCFIFLGSHFVDAAGDRTVAGGRAAAMGTTSVTLPDEWSANNNQAGLAWCSRFGAGIYYESRYLLKDLSREVIALTLPAGHGAFGISIDQFGFSLYSEMNAGLAYGMRLTKWFAAGVRVNYLRLHIADGFKDNHVVSCAIGLQFRASEHLWLGLHVDNPVPVKLSAGSHERLPTIMQFGISWRITEDLHADLEVEKYLVHKPVLKGGIEYRPAKLLFLRMGLLSNPATFTFGFGLEFGNLQFDIASSYHLVLGYSPQASIIYSFGKKKKAMDN
jgi:hypothetical protein